MNLSDLYLSPAKPTQAPHPMTDPLLQTLEIKLDQLIQECSRLGEENRRMREEMATFKTREADWQVERSRLIEKNELAKNRVEAMISRLKSLEEQH